MSSVTAAATARVFLKPGKAARFYARHPWVYDTAVARLEGAPADGDVVELVNEKGRFVARGVFNGHSRLMVRLYAWDESQALDEAFWRQRIERAIALRRQLGYGDPAGAERLVFSEADGLSGLVVDRYAAQLVVQVNALAIDRRLPLMLDLLRELQPYQGITLRSDEAISKHEGMRAAAVEAHALHPAAAQPADAVSIVEHGIRYQVDVTAGHKTGWYLDQRENRLAAARYLRDGRVLDLFCYTGGFSLAAAAVGRAREVLGIDSGAKAIAMARANAQLNGLANVQFQQQDCFEALDAMVAAGQRYDAVILDPPKFTRSRKAIDEALRAYHRINRLAVELLVPGGILVTCSCSGNVRREDFFDMLTGVGQKARRTIQLLEQRGAAPDHPVTTACPESEYLKCFICRVE